MATPVTQYYGHFKQKKKEKESKCITHFCIPAGEESGGFSFTVTDGQHTTPLYQFVVTARPLTITVVTQEELVVFPGNTQISFRHSLHFTHILLSVYTWQQAPFCLLVFKSGV